MSTESQLVLYCTRAGAVLYRLKCAYWTGGPTQSALSPLPHSLSVVETPLEMASGMLRSLGAPLDPLTIEGLETSFRDDDIWWGGGVLLGCEVKDCKTGGGVCSVPFSWDKHVAPHGCGLRSGGAPTLPALLLAGVPSGSTCNATLPPCPQRLLHLDAAHGHLLRDQAPRRLLCALHHGEAQDGRGGMPRCARVWHVRQAAT